MDTFRFSNRRAGMTTVFRPTSVAFIRTEYFTGLAHVIPESGAVPSVRKDDGVFVQVNPDHRQVIRRKPRVQS